MRRIVFILLLQFLTLFPLAAQQSVARKWNEALLEGIRNDFARPTVHARNLFHISAAMYDAWAAFSTSDETYLLGKVQHGFNCTFEGFIPASTDLKKLQEEAMSYAVYRMIEHRFANSPGVDHIMETANDLMTELELDNTFTSTDYATGSAAALGNYIASQYIAYGLLDGANEAESYENQYYEPVNESFNLKDPGNPGISNPNRWQPIAFDLFIDQSGNEIPGGHPPFLSPEWGWVKPFSLKEEEKVIKQKDGNDYVLYHDPGPPPNLDPINGGIESDYYKWTFSLVAVWSGHLDANLEAELDISPASLGNLDLSLLPTDFSQYSTFYDYTGGGDPSTGHDVNPRTGNPYTPQVVKLGDYARILAEFWADGPNSETPPGHWFTILNYVNDQPELERRWAGSGPVLDQLEWDVKSYLVLGGAMHDVAITAWGIKGYYDYVRPASAIRYMAGKGQSSDPDLPNYHIAGIPLVENFIALVTESDPLVGESQQHLNKIKLKAWKGPDYINDPKTDVAGVDWILAENWWPYQRPTFITPPFAGYISGHSTFSRAAAEVLTRLTGDRFFPGGVGTFPAPKNEFLVFEEGPSEDIILQWATYQDASDQCSLSRIWGGIHPPADDINGRLIGFEIGNEAFDYALEYFNKEPLGTFSNLHKILGYPNPVKALLHVKTPALRGEKLISLRDLTGRKLLELSTSDEESTLNVSDLPFGNYILTVMTDKGKWGQLIIKQ